MPADLTPPAAGTDQARTDDLREQQRERLIEWASGEDGMPWGGAVRDTVARSLGITGLQLRDEIEAAR